ncbi:PD40 domain-containing protein [Microbispora sp. H11081]|uniref:TolB family protein n=1 Tax=Microbispora sp. H11081 TaxID=2729107 RepID=UPI0014731021|nr:PD40 domain-containing protein [Microbispora sp. H11081]
MNTRLLCSATLSAAFSATLSATLLGAPAAPAAAAPATSAAAAALAGASAAPTPLAGVAVYLSYGKGFPISRYEPGRGFSKVGAMPMTGQFSASPDGRKVAWITDRGLVRVGDGRTAKTVAKGAAAGFPCATPVWSPDSRQVAYVRKGVSDAGQISIVGADGRGGRKAGATLGVCHLAWSAGGRYLAGYAGTTEGVYRLDLRTGKSVKVKGVGLANHVQGLSPDGAKVVVAPLSRNAPGGDGSWPGGFRPAVVDVATGRKTAIPVKGSLIGAFFLRDGRLAVRVAGRTANTLVVLDKNGRQVQRLSEPAAARRQALLQVVR